MAKEDTQFKKGQSGNPAGRKPLPPETRAARNMAYEEYVKAMIEVWNSSKETILNMDMDKECLGKAAIFKAYLDLDYSAIKAYEDRLFGKAKEKVQLVDEDDASIVKKVIVEFVSASKKEENEPNPSDS